jgi:hypothetical protein
VARIMGLIPMVKETIPIGTFIYLITKVFATKLQVVCPILSIVGIKAHMGT